MTTAGLAAVVAIAVVFYVGVVAILGFGASRFDEGGRS